LNILTAGTEVKIVAMLIVASIDLTGNMHITIGGYGLPCL
jgi:hypothetical protein